MNNPRLQAWRGKGVENALLRWVYGEAETYRGNATTTSAPPRKDMPARPDLQANATPANWFLRPGESAN